MSTVDISRVRTVVEKRSIAGNADELDQTFARRQVHRLIISPRYGDREPVTPVVPFHLEEDVLTRPRDRTDADEHRVLWSGVPELAGCPARDISHPE